VSWYSPSTFFRRVDARQTDRGYGLSSVVVNRSSGSAVRLASVVIVVVIVLSLQWVDTWVSVIGGAGFRRLAVFCPPARKGRQVQGRRSPRVKLGPHDGFRAVSGNDLAQTGLMRGCGPGTPRPTDEGELPRHAAAVLGRPNQQREPR
jgi:hypothetical protein